MDDGTGLRERKKQRTRDTIARVALELFEERGYDATTLADIAEAADISPRTIFAYYSSKEDILFSEFPAMRDALERELSNRPAEKGVLEAIGDFLVSTAGRPENAEIQRRRVRIVEADETLRNQMQARLAGFEEIVAAAIARELGATEDDLRPSLAAASLMAGFGVMFKTLSSSERPPSSDQLAASVGSVTTFVRGGLDATGRIRGAEGDDRRTHSTDKTRALPKEARS